MKQLLIGEKLDGKKVYELILLYFMMIFKIFDQVYEFGYEMVKKFYFEVGLCFGIF